MDPSQQFLSSSSPPWLDAGEKFSEFVRTLELEENSPTAPDYVANLVREYEAKQIQSLDGTSDDLHKQAKTTCVWEDLLALLNHPTAMSSGRDSWDEWTAKLTRQVVQIIKGKAESAEKHRDKLIGVENCLEKSYKTTNEIATRSAQASSSSAAAREGASALTEKEVVKLRDVALDLCKQKRILGKRNLELTKLFNDLAGFVQNVMEASLKHQKPNYVPVSSVIGVNFQ